MPFFYFDYYYLLLVVPALIIAMVAQIKVQSTYKKYAQVASRSGITASEMTRRMLDTSGLTHVDVVHIGGNLTDNFNPKKQTISLSDRSTGAARSRRWASRRTRRAMRSSTRKGTSRSCCAAPSCPSRSSARPSRPGSSSWA